MRHALILAVAVAVQAPAAVTLQVRAFNGADDVTRETRIVVFKAGDRQAAIAQSRPGVPLEAAVPAGFYDVQAVREQDGRVVNIRWAERLVVMLYPDEDGRHLEVVNFQSGFGALEVRGHGPEIPDVAIFQEGARDHEAARRMDATAAALFVVPAGRYDLRVRRNGATTWHPGIEVPPDRTRFWVVQ